MAWLIEFEKEAEKELKKLDRQVGQQILKFLRRVAELESPRSVGEALKGSKFGDYWKYRIGDYRAVCDIQDNKLRILVVRIGNRRDLYRK